MKTFRTNDGTEWRVVVNVLTIKRVMDLTGLRLTDLFSTADKIQEFFANEVRFCEVLYATIKPDADAAGKSIDDFLAVIDGSVFEAAAEALLAEVVDFFPEPRKGLLKKVLEKYQGAVDRLRTAGAPVIEKKLAQMDFDRLFESTLTSSASSSPALAELIHGDTPSAN